MHRCFYWMTRLAKRSAMPCAVLTLVMASAGFSSATPLSLIDGFGQVNTATGSVNTGPDTTLPNGLASVDADNYAQYAVNRAAGVLGARAGNSSASQNSFVNLTHSDSWVCVGQLCTLPVLEPLPVMFDFSLSGTASDSGGFLSVSAAYTDGTAGMTFTFVENNPDGPDGVTATFCTAPGVGCVDLHPMLTLDNNDVFHFSVSAAVHAVLCATPCPIPFGVGGPLHTGPIFTDTQSLHVNVHGDDVPEFADALDPFSVSITSLDPSVQLMSVDGRTTAGTPTGVPEPGTALLFVAWLGILWFRRLSLPARGAARPGRASSRD
jgi:hypothetical protein